MKKLIIFLLAFIIGCICIATITAGLYYNANNIYLATNNESSSFFPKIIIKLQDGEHKTITYNLDEIVSLNITDDINNNIILYAENSSAENIEIDFYGDYELLDGQLNITPLKEVIHNPIQITIRSQKISDEFYDSYYVDLSMVNDLLDQLNGGTNE